MSINVSSACMLDTTMSATYLGDRNASTRGLANLTDLAAGPADDATNHVRGNADVLRLDLFTVLVMSGGATRCGIRIRAAAKGAATTVTEVSSIASAHDTGASVLSPAATRGTEAAGAAAEAAAAGSSWLSAHNGVVENRAGSALPVVYKALANLPNGALDTLGSTLDFDNALGRLGKHLFLSNHAHTR